MKERIERLRNRARVFTGLILFFFLIILLRCFHLQILKGSFYKTLARRNATLKILIKAPRGRIFDRKGRLLVENRATFSLFLIRALSESPAKTLAEVSKIVKIPLPVLLERLYKHRDYPKRKPIVIAENLTIKEVSLIEAFKEKFPEIMVEVEPKRYYLYPKATAHIVGYVGEASKRDIEKMKVEMGDMVGKMGLEREYDRFLRGEDGYRLLLRDSLGNPVKLKEEVLPREGSVLVTSIDLGLQLFIYRRLKDLKGSAIVISPETGEILAMVSSPSFNANLMSSRFEDEYKIKIMNDPSKPLYTRAIQGTYPIGSIFKLAVAVAALVKKVVTPTEKVYCPGFFRFGGRDFRCWNSVGHGWVNLYKAIEQSCNVYFYKMGARLGIDNLVDVVSHFPFGRKTGVDLPNEKSGILPSPEWKKKALGVQWFPGETISLAIGQGYLIATPLQTALFGTAIANRGWYPQPHFVKTIGGKSLKDWKRVETGINPRIFENVIKGMKRVVERGTGRVASIPGLEICGKTGTAQVVALEKTKKIRPHSLFLAFAPCKNPDVVVFVIVERSGAGSELAAPITREILKFYFNEKNKGN